jgi:hypothetical protein
MMAGMVLFYWLKKMESGRLPEKLSVEKPCDEFSPGKVVKSTRPSVRA